MVTKNTKQIGLGAAALAAAGLAAGYYFYASKNAKRNRKIAVQWATKMKTDILREAKKVKDLDRAQLLAIIDQAAKVYEKSRGINRDELVKAAKELKANWEALAKEALSTTKRSARTRASSKNKTTRKRR